MAYTNSNVAELTRIARTKGDYFPGILLTTKDGKMWALIEGESTSGAFVHLAAATDLPEIHFVSQLPSTGIADHLYILEETGGTTSVWAIDDTNTFRQCGLKASDYWTKTEVAEAIAGAQHIKIKKVDTLPPVAEGEENVIYLVPAPDGVQGDVFDEYLKINNAWEKIGTTRIDLTLYLTKTEAATTYQVKSVKATNVVADNWVNSTVQGYSYQCTINITGVTADTIATVMYSTADAASGNYAPFCDTAEGTLTIYGKVNTTITIPTVVLQN